MTRPTYDEIRAAAVPCAGGCQVLVTHGRWCHACIASADHEWRVWLDGPERQRLARFAYDRLRRGQPDAHGGIED